MSKDPQPRPPSVDTVSPTDDFSRTQESIARFSTIMEERFSICPVLLLGLLPNPPTMAVMQSLQRSGVIIGYIQLNRYTLEERRALIAQCETVLADLRKFCDAME